MVQGLDMIDPKITYEFKADYVGNNVTGFEKNYLYDTYADRIGATADGTLYYHDGVAWKPVPQDQPGHTVYDNINVDAFPAADTAFLYKQANGQVFLRVTPSDVRTLNAAYDYKNKNKTIKGTIEFKDIYSENGEATGTQYKSTVIDTTTTIDINYDNKPDAVVERSIAKDDAAPDYNYYYFIAPSKK